MKTDFKSNYQTIINAPLEKVWEALINPEIVKQYFFGSNLLTDWKVGNPIYFQGEYEGKSYQDKGTVLEYNHNQKLVYSYLSNWGDMEDKPENYLLITYEVKELHNKTQLTITQTNYDEEKAKHSEESWGVIIDGLKKIIE